MNDKHNVRTGAGRCIYSSVSCIHCCSKKKKKLADEDQYLQLISSFIARSGWLAMAGGFSSSPFLPWEEAIWENSYSCAWRQDRGCTHHALEMYFPLLARGLLRASALLDGAGDIGTGGPDSAGASGSCMLITNCAARATRSAKRYDPPAERGTSTVGMAAEGGSRGQRPGKGIRDMILPSPLLPTPE